MTDLSHRLSRGGLVYAIAAIVPTVQGVVGIALFPRVLGPTEYGVYALAAGVAASVVSVGGDWLVAATMRFVPEGERDGRSAVVLKALGILGLLLSVPAVALALVLLYSIGQIRFALLVVTLIAVSFIGKTAQGLLRSREAHGAYLRSVVLGGLAALSLSVVGVLTTRRADAILWGQIMATTVFIGSVLADRCMRREVVEAVLARRVPDDVRAILRFGAPIAATGVGGQTLQLADRYVITAVLGERFTGLYSPSYAAGEKLVGIPMGVVFNTYYPIATRMWVESRKDETVSLLGKMLGIYITIGVGVSAALGVAGREIARLVLGEAFVGSWMVLPITAAAVTAWYCGIVFHQLLELEKRTAVVTAMVGSAAVLNLILNAAVVPRAGITGAALATAVSYCIYAVLARYVGLKVLGRQVRLPWGMIRGACLGAVALVAVSWLIIPTQPLLALCAGVVAYVSGVGIAGDHEFNRSAVRAFAQVTRVKGRG